VPNSDRPSFAGVPLRRLAWAVPLTIVVLALGVIAARWLRELPVVAEFMAQYPGGTIPPDGAPVGIPAWLAWQHFLSAFLLVMLVRTGMLLRSGERPPAFWTRDNTRFPRTRRAPRRLGIPLWLHLVVDVLWIACGVSYVVLLFATGQWVRIVPTDWSVVPNAISALLQYASLDWPVEKAWVSYNAIQQLSYFVVVFVAAPLAILTGLRLSPVWPLDGPWVLAFPERFAKALHYPIMLFFLAFTFVHVLLVLTTGALRNLNAMYAARDSDDWVGFVIFVLSVVVMIGGWMLAKPLVLVPLAARFGRVQRVPQKR
jgi:thiosulfate reductase cytochrome b subunit